MDQELFADWWLVAWCRAGLRAWVNFSIHTGARCLLDVSDGFAVSGCHSSVDCWVALGHSVGSASSHSGCLSVTADELATSVHEKSRRSLIGGSVTCWLVRDSACVWSDRGL